MNMDNRVVIAGVEGWVELIECIEGIKGDVKIKIK